MELRGLARLRVLPGRHASREPDNALRVVPGGNLEPSRLNRVPAMYAWNVQRSRILRVPGVQRRDLQRCGQVCDVPGRHSELLGSSVVHAMRSGQVE
mmetsp:Transcript_10/g.70  ORF Transcript_10/g.70 Transcript_10/m.70 type:complete len:97 (+) Transcript_10:2788-3078(+)